MQSISITVTFRTLDFSEVLPDKLYLSGVFPVNEENLRKMEISFVVRGKREGYGMGRMKVIRYFNGGVQYNSYPS